MKAIIREKPRYRIPYCEYCHEYATVKQLAAPDWVTDGPLITQPPRRWELVCKNHERNYNTIIHSSGK